MELPPSRDRRYVYQEGPVEVYEETMPDGTIVMIAVAPKEMLRVYPDGTRSHIKANGEQVTYYPDNTYALDIPGHPTVQGETQFNVLDT